MTSPVAELCVSALKINMQEVINTYTETMKNLLPPDFNLMFLLLRRAEIIARVFSATAIKLVEGKIDGHTIQ